MTLLPIILAAIQLTGVTGDKLRARAFFDANNVSVRAPLELTIDFIGSAEFASLHPPALSRSVAQSDWKLYDDSAKTSTYSNARRLTYRVRPLREGVLWFPSLEFEYSGPSGEKRLVKTNAIPVHAKPSLAAGNAEMDDADEPRMPQPDELITTPPDGLSEDDLFAWRKACARPSADAFAAFDSTEAKLNEARCAILEGDWKRAIDVCSRLEWRTGQTPAIEHALLAALAIRFQDPEVELPIWRQVGRPLLSYGWLGRFAIVFGGAAAFVLVFWLLGRLIRALACLALIAAFVPTANAQMFTMNMFSDAPEISARVDVSRPDLQVGDAFDFIVRLEAPKGVSLGQIQLTPSESFGLKQIGQSSALVEEPSANPSNVVMRMSVPVRYDVPFKGCVAFTVSGMSTIRRVANGGMFNFTSSTSFSRRTAPLDIEIRPLTSDGQPADFSGIIADRLRLFETLDLRTVETNDVVTITYKLEHNGYLPEDWMPQGAAFGWDAGEWRRYLVADGVAQTPVVEIVYYDPVAKSYRTITTGGTPLTYSTP